LVQLKKPALIKA